MFVWCGIRKVWPKISSLFGFASSSAHFSLLLVLFRIELFIRLDFRQLCVCNIFYVYHACYDWTVMFNHSVCFGLLQLNIIVNNYICHFFSSLSLSFSFSFEIKYNTKYMYEYLFTSIKVQKCCAPIPIWFDCNRSVREMQIGTPSIDGSSQMKLDVKWTR